MTPAATAAAISNPLREIWLDSYGTPYNDLSAMRQAITDLAGPGIIRLPNRAVDWSSIALGSPLVLPTFVSVRGATPMPDQARNSAFNYTGIPRIILPSLPTVFLTSSADAATGATQVSVSGTLTGLMSNMRVRAHGISSGYATSAAVSVGDTSVPISTAGAVTAGDIVQFAGDTNQYIVKTGVSSNGSIVLDSPVLAAVASGTAMNILESALLPPGTFTNGISFSQSFLALDRATYGTIPASTVISVEPYAIGLTEDGCGIEDVLFIKAGIATPAASNSAALSEVQTWATGGTALMVNAYGPRVRNCMMIGFRTALTNPRVNRSTFYNVRFDCWNGVVWGPSGDGGSFFHLRGVPLYTVNQSFTTTDATQRRGGTAFLGSQSADLEITDAFDIGYYVGRRIHSCYSARGYGCSSDAYGSATNAANLWVDGHSLDYADFGNRLFGNIDCLRLDIYEPTTGASIVYSDVKFFGTEMSTTGGRSCLRIIRGGAAFYAPSAKQATQPVILEDGCTYFSIDNPVFQGGTGGNAFTLPPTSTPTIYKRGGVFSNYVDNLGDIQQAALNSYSTYLTLGNYAFGPQLILGPGTGGTPNAAGKAQIWASNGGTHYGTQSGNVTIHTQGANYATFFQSGLSGNLIAGMVTTFGFAGTRSLGVAAAGSTQSTATVIAAQYNEVSAASASATGVSLPVNLTASIALTGSTITVSNTGAIPVLVYPLGGMSINYEGNSLTANAPFIVMPGTTADFYYASSSVISVKSGVGVPLIPKLSVAPTVAPGAGRVFLYALTGTNSGTAKIQALAGTSATPLTIADNIGGGF